jgi:hypothetical protein
MRWLHATVATGRWRCVARRRPTCCSPSLLLPSPVPTRPSSLVGSESSHVPPPTIAASQLRATVRMVLLARPAVAAGWGGTEPGRCARVVGTGEASNGSNAEGSGDAEPGRCAHATGSSCHTGATPRTQFLPALPP